MTRYLKTLGLALSAAFALSALASASASATNHEFRTDEPNGTASITAHELKPGTTEDEHGPLHGEQVFKATTGEGEKTLKCKEVHAVGSFKDGANAITVTPEYKNCAAYFGTTGKEEEYTPKLFRPETEKLAGIFVEFKSCHYNFLGVTTETTTLGTEGHHASVELHCDEEGDHVEIRVTSLKLKCISLPEQTIADAVHYQNVANGDVKVHATAHGIISTTTNSAGCPTPGGETVVHDNLANGGTYTGEVLVEGFNGGNPTDISVSPGTT
jgi:hypothetical protein